MLSIVLWFVKQMWGLDCNPEETWDVKDRQAGHTVFVLCLSRFSEGSSCSTVQAHFLAVEHPVRFVCWRTSTTEPPPPVCAHETLKKLAAWCNLLAVLFECYEAHTFWLPQGSTKPKAVPGNLCHSCLQLSPVDEVYIWSKSHKERESSGEC